MPNPSQKFANCQSPQIIQSPHRHPRPVGKHARRNVHRGQLLEQQLGRVWNVDLRDSVLIVAQSTFEEALLQFSARCQLNLSCIIPYPMRDSKREGGESKKREKGRKHTLLASSTRNRRKCARGTGRKRRRAAP